MLPLQGKNFHQTWNKPPPIIVAYFLQEDQVGPAFIYALHQGVEATFDTGALLPDIELQNFQRVSLGSAKGRSRGNQRQKRKNQCGYQSHRKCLFVSRYKFTQMRRNSSCF